MASVKTLALGQPLIFQANSTPHSGVVKQACSAIAWAKVVESSALGCGFQESSCQHLKSNFEIE